MPSIAIDLISNIKLNYGIIIHSSYFFTKALWNITLSKKNSTLKHYKKINKRVHLYEVYCVHSSESSYRMGLKMTPLGDAP